MSNSNQNTPAKPNPSLVQTVLGTMMEFTIISDGEYSGMFSMSYESERSHNFEVSLHVSSEFDNKQKKWSKGVVTMSSAHYKISLKATIDSVGRGTMHLTSNEECAEGTNFVFCRSKTRCKDVIYALFKIVYGDINKEGMDPINVHIKDNKCKVWTGTNHDEPIAVFFVSDSRKVILPKNEEDVAYIEKCVKGLKQYNKLEETHAPRDDRYEWLNYLHTVANERPGREEQKMQDDPVDMVPW